LQAARLDDRAGCERERLRKGFIIGIRSNHTMISRQHEVAS
jgi:hypothetical protein